MPETRIASLEQKVYHLENKYSESTTRLLGLHEALSEVTAALRSSVESACHTARALEVCERLLRKIEEDRSA